MKGMQIFNYGEQTVRTHLDEQGCPWWVAKDVCAVLGLKKSENAYKRVDLEDKADIALEGDSQRRTMLIVNESGLYSLIFQSKTDTAKQFKKWVTSEVLPSIRKTGSYSIKPLTIDEHLALLATAGVDTRQRLTAVEQGLDTVKAIAIEANSRNSANTGFMTVRGYCNVNRIKLISAQSSKLGKTCAALTRGHGAEIRRTDDEMYGAVNSYPIGILDEACRSLGFKAEPKKGHLTVVS